MNSKRISSSDVVALKLKTAKVKVPIHENKSTKIKRDIVLNMAYSSNGLGYETLNLMIASSNLRYVTNEFGVVAEFMSYD